MRKMQKTKQGMASIYVVVFVTMLIGVITLSFLRIMLSESGRTEKSTLADSAMNSAMAGVEDAKIILTTYDQCLRGEITDSRKCNDVKDKVTASAEGCDLGATTSETSVGYAGENNSGSISDQAYTCVNLTVRGNFVGRIDDASPVLVVPMRIENKGKYNEVEGVKITWTSSANGENVGNLGDKGYTDPDIDNGENISGVLGSKGVTANGSGDSFSNLNGLKVTLIQSGADYNVEQFYASDGDQTNRATLMLLPSDVDGSTSIDSGQMVNSANKTYNAPIAVACGSTYSGMCVADLHFPEPKGGSRIEDTFFLVISRVYSEPVVDEVTVTMYTSDNHTKENEIDFFNVQPIVDSTGRAGDLVRRVEVRLGSDPGQYVPLAELTVDGDLSKDFFVTKNCINGTSTCTK